jgi:hypothetical protein
LRPGLWRAEGEYRDAAGHAALVSGETTIRHEEGKWHFEGVLRVRGDRPSLSHNRYEIEPLAAGARSTHWSTSNPVLGTLRGRFVISGDAILSFYANSTGRYRGFECIQQRDESRYDVRGAVMEEDKVISTWSIELIADK